MLKLAEENREILLPVLYRLLQISIRFKRKGESKDAICLKLAEVEVLSDKKVWLQLADQILSTDMLRNFKRLYANSSKAI